MSNGKKTPVQLPDDKRPQSAKAAQNVPYWWIMRRRKL